ncbi:hypothetical protein [Nocardioides sp. W7]|uniref:hypothetical protein n=1 Tax=Nocardioides sp. W7 TaxID=2931390 RepID=UPI001FD2F58D|nr:hypothetical protein [Nocardioides sp. W7]
MRTTAARRQARAAAALLAAALVVTAGGCSGDDGGDDAGGGPPRSPAASVSPTAAPAPVTTARIGRVAGTRISRATGETLQRQVVPIVDAWFDGAYVGGTWPRAGVGGAFAGFTAGARRDVRRDRRVMSNVDIGDRITGVSVRRRAVALDVLAVQRRAVAVTARVSLRFRTTGEVARVETVRGRLFLTKGGGHGWQVFGYDVSAGARPAATEGRSR